MNMKNKDGEDLTPEEQLEHDRQQMKLLLALKNEVGELVIRYSKARLDTVMLCGVLVSAAMKVESAVNAVAMTKMPLMKGGAMDKLINALEKYKEAKANPDKEGEE